MPKAICLRHFFGFAGARFHIAPDFIEPMTIFILPAGGFFTLGCVIAILGVITRKKPKRPDCAACPVRESCNKPESREVT